MKHKSFSSDLHIDMNKEYVYWNYPNLRRENSPVYGVSGSEQVVFCPVDIDMLCYLLMSKGTYLILFGGVWSQATQDVIDRIQFYARKYGVDTIYLFDFSADGTAEASIKRDLSEQESYDGPGKKSASPFAVYNYIYGEIVTRYLTNLNDWVSGKIGTREDITYLNLYQDAVTVPNVSEPFLFLYNSQNTVDHGDCESQGKLFPIVWGLELKEADGDIDSILEEKIFRHIGEEGCVLTPYTYADYMYEAFAMNERGHSFKTENAFRQGEQINLCKVNFQVFRWMLDQKGSFIFELAGPWCAYSQGSVATVNDYAVANEVRVYMVDVRLDGKHPIDFWKYPRKNELTMGCPPLRKYDIELWEKYFPGAPIICSFNPNLPFEQHLTVDYTDEQGKEHHVLNVGVPYILAYNKDHINQRGQNNPLLATHHDAGELINCSKEYIYYEPNYRVFSSAMYNLFYVYKESMGEEFRNISIDRTAPLVEGEPVEHVETVAYTKEHDWYKERAYKANQG